jgi:arylsulfatase A-like enzyme
MILLILFDGLRPDQITKKTTPNICRVIQQGVRFLHHHATFPTDTRVNVASFVTGCYPGGHGLVGNQFYVHHDGVPREIDTGSRHSIVFLDEVTEGKALQRKSLGEILGQAGKKVVSINVGSSGNTYLNNHKACETGGLIVHPEFTIPASESETLESRFGRWPSKSILNTAQIHRATTLLIDYVIPEYNPTVASLWFSEPDSTEHKTGVSSLQAREAISQADAELGRILDYVEDTELASSTDVLVASDHGLSTVTQTVDVAEELVQAGLKEATESTEVLVTGAGGCVLIYVYDHNEAKVKAITEFLITQPWCGPLFTSASTSSIPSSFPLSLIRSQNLRSPDILMSFAWGSARNSHGVKGGGAFARGGVDVGCGNHGSISPYEIQNVLVATGPHFKQGVNNPVPSGNIDILPTVLHLLDLAPPEAVDGRVLFEALEDGWNPEEVSVEAQIYQAEALSGNTAFRQKLQISKIGQTIYVDKGWVLRN